MSETYLDGKITVTSLAAPTADDQRKIDALSNEERKALLDEALERGWNSPIGTRSREEIVQAAKERAAALTEKPEYAV